MKQLHLFRCVKHTKSVITKHNIPYWLSTRNKTRFQKLSVPNREVPRTPMTKLEGSFFCSLDPATSHCISLRSMYVIFTLTLRLGPPHVLFPLRFPKQNFFCSSHLWHGCYIPHPYCHALSAPVQTGPGAHPASYTMGTGYLSREVKQLGRGVNQTTPPSAEVKDRVELYLSTPLWALMAKSGANCTFLAYYHHGTLTLIWTKKKR